MIRIQGYALHPELWFASRVVIRIQGIKSYDSHPELWLASRAAGMLYIYMKSLVFFSPLDVSIYNI